MTPLNIRKLHPERIAAVHEFFERFYGPDIKQLDGPTEDLLIFQLGKESKIITVSEDFLADFEPQQIRENLASWNVAHLSRTLERGCRLRITSEGTEEEHD